MNKGILSLIILGLALTILHVPQAVLTVSIIGGLLVLTIRMFWSLVRSFTKHTFSYPE